MHFRLNLASRVYLDRRSVQRWLLLSAGLLALLLAVNLLYAWRNFQQLGQVNGHLAEIEEKLASQRGSSATAYSPERFAQVMDTVGSANKMIAADQFRWSALLGRLEELLPADVAIRSLKPDFKERSLEIAAIARDTAVMTELLDALLSSPDLQRVSLLNQAWDEQAGGVKFSIAIKEAF
ncbi:MAG: PilN domain-containing protein [Deltaproteobacteria bacterium]|nr:MAG: PilN domain-containing protein [Deltaproteobacteria bacterium]